MGGLWEAETAFPSDRLGGKDSDSGGLAKMSEQPGEEAALTWGSCPSFVVGLWVTLWQSHSLCSLSIPASKHKRVSLFQFKHPGRL